MLLVDRSIEKEIAGGRITFEPLDIDCIQTASVDVHPDKRTLVFGTWGYHSYVDVKPNLDDLAEIVETEEEKLFFLQPGQFVLASTLERITVRDDMVARVDGKSSLGRIGSLIHSIAGYLDPG